MFSTLTVIFQSYNFHFVLYKYIYIYFKLIDTVTLFNSVNHVLNDYRRIKTTKKVKQTGTQIESKAEKGPGIKLGIRKKGS